jgi:hypothetical protein
MAWLAGEVAPGTGAAVAVVCRTVGPGIVVAGIAVAGVAAAGVVVAGIAAAGVADSK